MAYIVSMFLKNCITKISSFELCTSCLKLMDYAKFEYERFSLGISRRLWKITRKKMMMGILENSRVITRYPKLSETLMNHSFFSFYLFILIGG